MEFKDMQVIWNNQNQERLFAINEAVLFEHIKSKGKSVNHWVNLFEWFMIGLNILVAIVLLAEVLDGDTRLYQFILPPMYLAYAIVIMVLRRKRYKGEKHFEDTMLGELDKAIWHIDWMMKQGQSMTLWYTLPLVLVVVVLLALNAKLISGWTLLLLLALIVSYYGGRWETNKWYLPKKRELVAIREKLLEPPTE